MVRNSWLEIHGLVSSLLRNWAGLESVMWGHAEAPEKLAPLCEEPALDPTHAPWMLAAKHEISFLNLAGAAIMWMHVFYQECKLYFLILLKRDEWNGNRGVGSA